MENNVKYSFTGKPIKIRIGVIPHFFYYQEERTNKKSSFPRADFVKVNRKKEIDAILYSDEANKNSNIHLFQ